MNSRRKLQKFSALIAIERESGKHIVIETAESQRTLIPMLSTLDPSVYEVAGVTRGLQFAKPPKVFKLAGSNETDNQPVEPEIKERRKPGRPPKEKQEIEDVTGDQPDDENED